ncbi:MAG: hypothetical protein AAF587_36575 [Bacteroidota bacterium]
MKYFHISLSLIGLMLLVISLPSDLHGQSDKRKSGVELFVGAGPSTMMAKDGLADSLTINHQGGLQFGANFLLGLSNQLAFGLGVQLNNGSYLAGLPAFASLGAQTTHERLNEPFTQSLVASNVEERLEYSDIGVSPFLDFQLSDGKIQPYIRAGVNLLLPSATFQATNGTLSKEAIFEGLDRTGGTFGVTLSDLPKYGFNSGIGISDTIQDLPVNSTAFGFQAAAGIRFSLTDNLYFFLQGGLSQSAALATFNLNEYSPSSVGNQNTSVLSGTNSISKRDIKIKGGGAYLFGGPPPPVPPQFIQKVPIEFVQAPAKRRNQNASDPEFELLAPKILRHLEFKPSSYKIEVDPMTSEIRFDNRQGNPAAITVSTKVKGGDVELMPYDSKYSGSQDAYLVQLSTSNTKSLKMALMDTDTESEVDGFDVELFMVHPSKGDILIHKSEQVNSGFFIPKLYDHPEISYKLKLSHLCYEPGTALISSADFSKTKVMEAESKGEAEEIIIPIDQQGLDEFMRIQGTIQERNRKTPLSGTISGSDITLYAGCGQAPTSSFQLVLEKPLGYNLIAGSASSNWKESDVRVNIRNGKAQQSLKLETIPTYNLFYVDIGEFQNRNRPRRSILQQVNKLAENGQKIFVYLSDGQSPYTASSAQELPSVLSKIALIFPDVPKAETDRTLLTQRMNVADVMPSRRVVNFHFYLGRTLYETSRNELVNELTKAFPEGRENINIYLYTDFEVSDTQKLDGGVYKTAVEYIHLN